MKYNDYAIERLEDRLLELFIKESTPQKYSVVMLEAAEVIRQLKGKLAPPPNDPLTLEQLREMDGEPVWISWAGHSSEGWALVRVWSKADNVIYLTYHNGASDLLGYVLDNGAIVYRRKPEGPV